MILKYGNMWSIFEQTDLFLITTNSFIKKDGTLVMGAGIAKEARDTYNGLDLALGERIDHLSTYGLIISENWPTAKLGAFQVKTHFKDSASLELIQFSTNKLLEWCLFDGKRKRVDLNFPGIGNGKLNQDDVLPIIQILPDEVHIWQLK